MFKLILYLVVLWVFLQKSCGLFGISAKTECTNTALNCSQKCGVKPGGVEYCFCNVGYSLNANQMSCDGKYYTCINTHTHMQTYS